MTGIYAFGDAFTVLAEFQELRVYLISELNFNPAMTEAQYSEKINAFLKAYYGDGWNYVREYIDQTSALTKKSESHFVHACEWDDVISEADWRENCEYFVSLWEKALELAGDKAPNVKKSMTQMLYVELQIAYHDYEADASTENRDRFVELNQKYRDHIIECGLEMPEEWSVTRDPDDWEY